MIHLPQISLSTPQINQIRDWMLAPGAQAFAQLLSLKAAEATANLGNAMINDEPEATIQEAKAEAQKWGIALDVFSEVKNPEFQFIVSELKPKPLNPDESYGPDT